MLETQTRKTGNSISITIPAELNAQLNQKFIIAKTTNGGFVLVPKRSNPLDELPDNFHMEDEFQDSSISGNEVI